MEIGKALFDVLDRFELEDLSFLNEVDNHYERSELTEASLNARAFELPETVEETIMQHDERGYIGRLPCFRRNSGNA